MQTYENCDIDTRTFPEIWKGLTPAQQSELRFQLIKSTSCTRQSVNNWTKGVSPIYRDTRVRAAKCVNTTLGLNVNHTTLFPNAR